MKTPVAGVDLKGTGTCAAFNLRRASRVVTQLYDGGLAKAGVTNKLVTVKGGGHGMFPQADYVTAFDEIWKFLKDNKVH